MKKKIIIYVILFVIFITIASVVSELGKNVEIIFDVNEYSYISKEELINKLGEPLRIDEDIYIYEEKEFTVKNGIVTKLKYLPNNSIKYKTKNTIFNMFGIKPNNKTIKKTVDNGITYKFQEVADGIWEFEVYGVNEKDKTFDMVFISYKEK